MTYRLFDGISDRDARVYLYVMLLFVDNLYAIQNIKGKTPLAQILFRWNRHVLPWCWLSGFPADLYVVPAAAGETTIYSVIHRNGG